VKQAACIKEKDVAKNFGGNWGYLRARPDECKPRAFETRLVKYFDKGPLPSGKFPYRMHSLSRFCPPTPEVPAPYLCYRPHQCRVQILGTALNVVNVDKSDQYAGVASVREKRLALEGEARGDTPATPPEDKVLELTFLHPW